ncbi:MAG: hypothetical protein IPL10_02295 [Bacteroidetes bacterium]|nr:hypothetical protein [Bacteroidota bacterium]
MQILFQYNLRFVAHTIGFINTSNYTSGSITSNNWTYGDGNTSPYAKWIKQLH